jgi:hypothetical protein
VAGVPASVLHSASLSLFPAAPRVSCEDYCSSWEMQSSAFFLQHVVIVPVDALLLDPTLDIVVLFTWGKWVVGCISEVCHKATLSIAFPWLSHVIDQGSAGAGVYFCPRQRWRWLTLRGCAVFNVCDVVKCVPVFD